MPKLTWAKAWRLLQSGFTMHIKFLAHVAGKQDEDPEMLDE
jgi:hypothetical protein